MPKPTVFAAFILGAAFLRGEIAAASECNGLPQARDLTSVTLAALIRKTNFVSSTSEVSGCPSADPRCRRRVFVLPGDKVLIDHSDRDKTFVCAAFVDARGWETDGWLPRVALRPAGGALAWRGRWKRDESATIRIKTRPRNKIAVDGDALHGSGAATHEGSLTAILDGTKSVQGFAMDGTRQIPFGQSRGVFCAAMLKQLGPYVVVQDNNACGGAYVTFSGIYTRR